MNSESSKPTNVGSNDKLGLVTERAIPVAEVKCGRLRWHIQHESYSVPLKFMNNDTHLLYDQAALDAAVAADRERCAKLREALQASQSWLYGHDNTWGQAERRRLNDEALKA